MLYLYAFAEAPVALPDVAGIGGSALAAEDVGGLEAVVGEVDGEHVEASEEAVLAHARVVDALAAANDAVVPARFGRAFADAEALRRAVAGRRDALLAALAKVQGCVELGLRVLPPAAAPDGTASSGRDYMRARLEDQRRLRALADDLHPRLAAIARAATDVQTGNQLLSAAYLVPRASVEDFRRAVGELERTHPDVTLACTGPWPAYSFATADPEAK